MSQKNPKEVFHNTAYSVQLPYIAGHSLQCLIFNKNVPINFHVIANSTLTIVK